MMRSVQAGFEDSIANALGVLYERRDRGATLIRVLEDYRRFKTTRKTLPRTCRPIVPDQPRQLTKHELEHLYMRRAAVDQVIRSIEAYSAARNTAVSHR